MSPLFYLILFIFVIIICVAIAFRFLASRKTPQDKLYMEGIHNENEGNYGLALLNYEDALKEIQKHKPDKKFYKKITEKIKVLKTMVDYEKNFQRNELPS
jgi:hypothetical protein